MGDWVGWSAFYGAAALLAIAPTVDLRRRTVRPPRKWFCWMAAGLALLAMRGPILALGRGGAGDAAGGLGALMLVLGAVGNMRTPRERRGRP